VFPGQVHPGYTLYSVVIVTRHGDRSSIYSLPGVVKPKLSCQLSSRFDSRVHHFLTTMNGVFSRVPAGETFRRYGLFPNNSACRSGQLTAIGAVQMLQLGKHLRKRYIDDVRQRFVSNGSVPIGRVFVRTTEYSRTIQSMVALVHSFLPHIDLANMKIHTTPNIYFCSPTSKTKSICQCSVSSQTGDKDLKKKRQVCEKVEHGARTKVAKLLNVSTSKLPWTMTIVEVFVVHVCHRLGLPCFNNGTQCVSHDLLNLLWTIVDQSCNEKVDAVNEYLTNLVLSHSLLKEIAQILMHSVRDKARNNSHLITLYSGHDATLMALTRALDIDDGLWPPYASRLIFELYKRQFDDSFFIRVIFNGKDKTRQLRFCHSGTNIVNGLCRLENMLHFILIESVQFFKDSNLNQGCF